MSGGVLVWGALISVSIGGVDRTAHLVGAGEIDRELDAQSVAVVRLRHGSAKPNRGAEVAIGGIVAATWVGRVTRVSRDPASGAWVVNCSDRLWEQFDSLSSGAAVCAALPAGAIWHRDLHGDWKGGRAAAKDALTTLPCSIYMDGGARCAVPWAGTGHTAVLSHAAGDIYEGSESLEEASEESLIAGLTATVQIVYSRLHHWSLTVGWAVAVPPSDPASSGPAWTDAGWSWRRFLRRPFSLPTRDVVAAAMTGNSWSVQVAGAGIVSAAGGDGSGISYEGLPGSGIYLGDVWLPMDVAATLVGCLPDVIYLGPGAVNTSKDAVIKASARLGRQWAQSVEEVYTITVRAPAGTPGLVLADESASHTAPSDDAAWDAGSAAAVPAGAPWQGGWTHQWADVVEDANRTLVLRGMAQTLATRIRQSWRQSVHAVSVAPGREPALGERCAILAEQNHSEGQVLGLHTTWDFASHAAACAVRVVPTTGSTAADDFTLPARPAVQPADAGYALATGLVLGTHIGGLTSSEDPQDDGWDGWVGNVQATDPTNTWGLVDLMYPVLGAPTYTEGFVVRTPDVPPAARDDQVGARAVEYEVATLGSEVSNL